MDSSVGGKTGINSVHGKNLVGAFHQPRLVLADLTALETLSPRHFAAGYAELAKYGLIDDEELFFWLEANYPQIKAGGPARGEAIARACAAKARVVVADEKEAGNRALLNLGHTFGHAWKKPPAIPTACCMAKGLPSAWCWPTGSRRSWVLPPLRMRDASKRI